MKKSNKILLGTLIPLSILTIGAATVGTTISLYWKLNKQNNAFCNATVDDIVAACSDAITFAKKYCHYYGNDKQEAIINIRKFILSDENFSFIKIQTEQYSVNAKIRLIGINEDTWADKNIDKDCFTFEFVDCLMYCRFQQSGTTVSDIPIWYDETYGISSILRNVCNHVLFKLLPKSLTNNINAVKKITGYTTEIDPKKTDRPSVFKTSYDYFFPLSSSEANINDYTGFLEEGSPYTFYNRKVSNSIYIKQFAGLYDGETKTDGCIYWLRSAYLKWGKSIVTAVRQDGSAYGLNSTLSLGALAPAFCI